MGPRRRLKKKKCVLYSVFFLKVGKSVECKKQKKFTWYLEPSPGNRFLSVFLFMSS